MSSASSPRPLFVSHSAAVSGAERVLFDLTPAFPGAGAFVFEAGELSRALAARGLDPVVSSRGARLAGAKRDAGLATMARSALTFGAVARDIARAAQGYDLLYANSQKAFTACALARPLARRPIVWHLHDILSRAHFGAAQIALQIGLANRAAEGVIAPSQAVAEAFVAAGGKEKLVRVVANGVAPAPQTTPRSQLRAALGLPAGPLVGVFSRLSPWKGQDVALRALESTPGAQILLAGAALFGPEADYEQKLRAQAAQPALAGRVHFLGQRGDVPDLMRAVDVVVHPSVDPEPFGLTLVEAMLAQTPVFASANGAAPEVLDNGACGLLLTPGDASALAQALRDFFAAPGAYGDRVVAARARAEALYTVERMQAGVVEAVRAALAP